MATRLAIFIAGWRENALAPSWRQCSELTLSRIAIPVVIVVSVSVFATIRHAYHHRSRKTEGQHCVAWNSNGSATRLTTLNCPNDAADEAIVPLRLLPVRICLNGEPPAVDGHRFNVNYQVIVWGYSHDHLGFGAPRNRQPTVLPSDVLIDGAAINPIVFAFNVNGFIVAYRNDRAWLQPCQAIPVAVVTISISILSEYRW
jgi:hypothetical protein